MGREREVKLRIPRADDFRRLAASGPILSTALQRNHYFDTVDRALERAGILVRVREEGARVVLTLKRGRSRGAGTIDADEWESEIAAPLWRAIGGGRAALASIGFAPLDAVAAGRALVPAGALENRRRVLAAPNGVRYELDETTFPWGEVHYELEVETDDPAGERDRACALLDRLGVAWDAAVETKHERLLRGVRRRRA